MHVLDQLSIRTKMTLLACTSAGVALLLTCIGFAAIGIHTLATAKVRQLQERAKLLALHSSPIITLRDREAGTSFLESMQSDESIELACVYDSHHRRVASWGDTSIDFPIERRLPGHRFVGLKHLEVVEPVRTARQEIGFIYLRSTTEDLRAELAKFARIAAYVLACALLVALLMSMWFQRAIARPILALTDAARRIATMRDYSIRVSTQAGAELKTLQDVFNGMLRQVESSEQALQRAHTGLEDRVAERTKELSQEVNRRIKIQHDLEQARDAAESANRAKSEFLANMSHEIRTPLNGILGFTDLLLRGDDDWTSEERKAHLETIRASGLHLADLIRDILDLSKVESGRMEVEKIECSPREIIEEVISTLSVRARDKNLKLDYVWKGGEFDTVESDPARLRQLLINLVSNAIKFTRTGGVRVIGEYEKMLRSTLLRIEVVDSGIGIPADKLDLIFEPFTQADSSVTRRYGGTGLGLAICRKITAALGGELTVTSEVGEGSVFTAIVDAGEVRYRDGVASRGSSGSFIAVKPGNITQLPKIRILVVDDGDTNRRLSELILRRAGAIVESAENGELAVRAALRRRFDLILMDMQMPVMDGYSATREIRKRGIRAPIIALTAHAMKGDEQRCFDAGCEGYLTKPVDADRLLAAVADSVASHRVADRPKDPAPSREAGAAVPDSLLTEVDGTRSSVIGPTHSTGSAEHEGLVTDNRIESQRQMAESRNEEGPVDVTATNSSGQCGHFRKKTHGAANRQDSANRGSRGNPGDDKRTGVGGELVEPIVSELPMDDPEIAEIVADFVDRLRHRLQEFHAALQDGDSEKLGKLAHWLKGVGGTSGFPILTERACLLENAARQKRWDLAAEEVDEIDAIADRIDLPRTAGSC